MIRVEKKGDESMGRLRNADRALWTLSQKLRGRQRTRERERKRGIAREREDRRR